jgi:hypothetical protein
MTGTEVAVVLTFAAAVRTNETENKIRFDGLRGAHGGRRAEARRPNGAAPQSRGR